MLFRSNLTSSAAAITLALNNTSPAGTLNGTLTVSALLGVATFNDLSVDTGGSNFKLDASSGVLTGATSSTFDVVSSPTLQFSALTAGAVYRAPAANRVYVRTSSAGSFTLTATPAGQASYAFPSLTGWTRTPLTNGSSNTVTYTESGDNAGSTGNSVTYATAGAVTSAASTFDVVADPNAPTGGAVSASATTSASGGLTLTVTAATDAGSGIATRSLQRYREPLSGGTCSAFALDNTDADGSASAVSGSGTVPVSGLSTGCYEWVLTATDNVGNTQTTTTAVVKVDRSAPSTPTLTSLVPSGDAYYSGTGTTVYVKAGVGATTTFAVTVATADSDSGIASLTFPTIAGFTRSVSGSTATYTAATPSVSDGGTGLVSSTNGVGTPSDSQLSFSVVIDGAAPTSTGLSAPASPISYSTTGATTVTWGSFADAGSGLASLTAKREVSTLASNACSGSWSTDTGYPASLSLGATSLASQTDLVSGS